MKIQRLAIAAVLLVSPGVFASDFSESHLKAAEELLEVSKTAELLDRSLDTMLKAQLEANPALADFEDVMRQFLTKHFSWETLRSDMVKIYAESFTEAELGKLIEFNKTPVGQKAVRLMPELMERGVQLGQQRVQDNMSELEELIRQRVEELNTE